MRPTSTGPALVVGAAVVRAGRLLATRRTEPPALAGLWEFPGGKVEPGETEVEALVRECYEELGLVVSVGGRVGPDVPIGTAVLRVYVCSVVSGELVLVDHDEARWLAPAELDDVPWIPADAPLVDAVRTLLSVTLREWSAEDFPLLVGANTPEMTAHLGGPETEEKLADRHRRYLAVGKSGTGWMFAVLVDGEPAGNIGCWERERDGGVVWETGWNVLPAYQGRGIAARAATLVLEHARADGRHRYVHAFPTVDNAASNGVCRRAGFELVGQCEYSYPPGAPPELTNDWRYDLAACGQLTRDDWQQPAGDPVQ